MARENLVNCDDATVYDNDKNPGISYLFMAIPNFAQKPSLHLGRKR